VLLLSNFNHLIMKTKLHLLAFVISASLVNIAANAQTTLAAGDISTIWNQADTPDDFAFITYIDLAEGKVFILPTVVQLLWLTDLECQHVLKVL
jgi:hypothetical protein